MGWFLSSGKGKRRSKARSSSLGPKWDPQRTLFGLKILGVIAAVVIIGAGWGSLERRLTAYVSSKTAGASAVNPDHILIADAPAWMSPTLVSVLQQQAASHLAPDPMEQHSLETARRALGSSPWLEQVHQVQRVSDGRVVVHAEFRVPVAVVQASDGFHLIDGKGVRLTGPYREAEVSKLGLPLIVGAAHGPSKAGDVWRGADIQGGLALIRLLGGQPFMHEIRAFDVSGRDARGRVRLSLHTSGSWHEWGLPPGQEQPIEPPAQVKLRSLASLYAQKKTIDLPGRRVDLRISSEAVFVEPVVAGDESGGRRYTW